MKRYLGKADLMKITIYKFKKEPFPKKQLFSNWQHPTLPGRLQPSTIGL